MTPATIVWVAGLVALATMGAVPAAAELRFRGAGLSAGLTAERRPLDYRVADMTGGAAVGDFNRDGWQDIFLLGGGGAVDALYLNNGDGTFTDHAAAAGLAWSHRGLAAAVGDVRRRRLAGPVRNQPRRDPAATRRPGAHRLYRNLGVPAAPADGDAAARAGRTPPNRRRRRAHQRPVRHRWVRPEQATQHAAGSRADLQEEYRASRTWRRRPEWPPPLRPAPTAWGPRSATTTWTATWTCS